MKTSYFTTDRGGRLHYQNLALYNNKSVCKMISGYYGLHAIIYDPYNNERRWYWEDKNRKLRTVKEFRDYADVDYIGAINDHKIRRKDNMASNHWLAVDYARYAPEELINTINPFPVKFHNIFAKFFEYDFILSPEVLLGYHHYVKDDKEGLKIHEAFYDNKPNIPVHLDFMIKQFRKRKNIIAYKEDIRHWARSWFLGGGDMKDDYESYYQLISCRLNGARKYHDAVKFMLERYDIPYESFNLDTGDYCKTFEVEKSFDRYQTVGTGTLLKPEHHYMIDEWIDRYMSEYP